MRAGSEERGCLQQAVTIPAHNTADLASATFPYVTRFLPSLQPRAMFMVSAPVSLKGGCMWSSAQVPWDLFLAGGRGGRVFPVLKSNTGASLEARSGSAQDQSAGTCSHPRTSLHHDWQAPGRSPAPGPQKGNSGQAHPPELPAGQAELGPDLKPRPCLSYLLRILLVAAGMTSLSRGLLLGNPAQNWGHRAVE